MSHEPAGTLTLRGPEHASPGEAIEVELYVSLIEPPTPPMPSDWHWTAMDAKLAWDPDIVEFDEAVRVAPHGTLTNNLFTAGEYQGALFSTQAYSSPGVMIKLVGQVLETAPPGAVCEFVELTSQSSGRVMKNRANEASLDLEPFSITVPDVTEPPTEPEPEPPGDIVSVVMTIDLTKAAKDGAQGIDRALRKARRQARKLL